MRYIPVLLALPSLALASFNCEAVQDGVKFDLRALRGSHSVTLPPAVDPVVTVNSTWTINPCGPIVPENGVPAEEQCPTGTQVCGIERVSLHHEAPTTYVIPIAGDIDGRHTDEALELLKAADVGAGKEGLRVTLNGGMYDETKQQAIIEFICDPDRTGLEGDDAGKRKREDEDEDDEKKEKDGRSLKFVSYDRDNAELHVLRLEWKTKYACKGASVEDPAPEQGSGWGFFTWFIIILFLGVAAYLIFGSWLAYNRYGARGRFTTNLGNGSWDLLPHSDTIRDIPYLLKDWARRVIGTLQGRSGGRGGYSAV